jgi:hypothetical protein
MRTLSQGASFPDELFLPTKAEVAFTLPMLLDESIDYKCKAPADTEHGSPELTAFLKSCVNKITGVTLFVDSPEVMRVDFQIPRTKTEENGG